MVRRSAFGPEDGEEAATHRVEAVFSRFDVFVVLLAEEELAEGGEAGDYDSCG